MQTVSNLYNTIISGKHWFETGVCFGDVTDSLLINEEDDVILFGRDGEKVISVEEVAEPAASFNYEAVCNISRRVPRVYIKDGKETEVLNYLR